MSYCGPARILYDGPLFECTCALLLSYYLCAHIHVNAELFFFFFTHPGVFACQVPVLFEKG